jgi:hypothetical protein
LTEVEYAQATHDAEVAYLEVICDPREHLDDGAKRMRRWWTIREKLSAHTVVRLCDAWLAQSHTEASGRAEPQAEGKE